MASVQAEGESREWQGKWQQALKELADVKERAWSLLEEKDLQLQSLKVTTPRCSKTDLQHVYSICYIICCCQVAALPMLVLLSTAPCVPDCQDLMRYLNVVYIHHSHVVCWHC